MPSLSAPDGNWIVTQAEGITVRPGKMRFEITDGAVFGQAPCNSFTAQLVSTDGEFNLGRVKLRGNVCAPDIMEDEQTYMRLLSRLSHFEISADGALVLSSFGTPTIRARPEG